MARQSTHQVAPAAPQKRAPRTLAGAVPPQQDARPALVHECGIGSALIECSGERRDVRRFDTENTQTPVLELTLHEAHKHSSNVNHSLALQPGAAAKTVRDHLQVGRNSLSRAALWMRLLRGLRHHCPF